MIFENDHWLLKFQIVALPFIKREYAPQKIILFGSRIFGNPSEDSDIDVIIVSDKFVDIPFMERMPLLIRQIRFPKHIDFLCYSPEEMERIKDTSSVVMDALENGIEIEI
ncbi:nucleotidyltransferase domain-containing protein [bacterium]|nr:nucleotidyltransferase domain-containing protein [bacterium]